MDPMFELKVKQAFSKVKEDINSLKEELKEYKALLKDLVNKMSLQLENKNTEKQDDFGVSRENQPNGKKSSIGNKGDYAFIHSFIHSPFTHLNTYSNKHSNIHSQNTLTSPINNNSPSKNDQIIQKNDLKNKELTLTFQKNNQELDQNNQLINKNNQNLPVQTLTFSGFPTQVNDVSSLDPTHFVKMHPLQTLTNKEFLVFLTIYRLEKELPRVTYDILSKHLSLTPGCIRSYITSLIRKKVPLIKSKINNKLIILSIDSSFRSITSEQKLINLYYQNDPSQSTLI